MHKEIIIIVICVLVAVALFVLNRMLKAATELKVISLGLKGGEGRGSRSRFCFISDVHIGKMTVPWSDVLEAVKEAEPEFILITGDIVNSPKDLAAAKNFLFTLSLGTGVPVVITPGNHDDEAGETFPGGRDGLFSEFRSVPGDVRVLDNDHCEIGGTLILGLDDVQRTPPDETVRGLVRDCAAKAASKGLDFIIATHSADMLVKGGAPLELPPEGVSGVFCGHTHGGQIRMAAGIEFGILKDDILPKRGIYYGAHEVEGFPVYITSGLGNALFPLRSGTRPEVVAVEIDRG